MQGSQIVNKVLFKVSIKNKCKYANGFVWETAEIFFITFYLRKMYLKQICSVAITLFFQDH